MKKSLLGIIFCFVILCFFPSHATQQQDSKKSGDNFSISGEIKVNETRSGEEESTNAHTEKQENQTEKLPEEGANVDTSITEKNYTVEAPTIVLLILFGILVMIALILIVMKI